MMVMRFDRWAVEQHARGADMDLLTDEEVDVFHLRRRGKSVTQVGDALGLSEATVHRREASIRHKLGQ